MKVFFVGLSEVPYASRACDIRLNAFADLFMQCGCDVTVLNRYSPNNVSNEKKTERGYEVKEMVAHKKASCLNAFWLLCSVIKEFFYLIRYHISHRNENVILHLYTGHYLDMLFYWLVSKLCGYKLVYQYVEYRSEHSMGARNFYHRINSYLCDYQGAKLWDGVIPISEFLKEKSIDIAPKITHMKVTPLCDFDKFERNRTPCDINEKYLLFCGSIDYMDTIDMIIQSYRSSRISQQYKLVFVISGNIAEIEKLRVSNADCVILTRLDYDVLISYYKHAFALFIPLKPISCEIARFPNKVCEYLASHGLVITTDVGEMKYFFKDGVNAIVASEFSVRSISERLDLLADGEYDVDRIRSAAHTLGRENFDISSYNEKIQNFIEKLFE